MRKEKEERERATEARRILPEFVTRDGWGWFRCHASAPSLPLLPMMIDACFWFFSTVPPQTHEPAHTLHGFDNPGFGWLAVVETEGEKCEYSSSPRLTGFSSCTQQSAIIAHKAWDMQDAFWPRPALERSGQRAGLRSMCLSALSERRPD